MLLYMLWKTVNLILTARSSGNGKINPSMFSRRVVSTSNSAELGSFYGGSQVLFSGDSSIFYGFYYFN